MKLLVLSDLHVEFEPFVPDEAALRRADAVVLAGDIHTVAEGVRWARQAFPKFPVIYVAGNHEFYGGHWTKTLDEIRAAARELDVGFLENESMVIGDVRFLGCSLWTDFALDGEEQRAAAMRAAESAMNDYRLIDASPLAQGPGATRKHKLSALHTLERHRESLAWLARELAVETPLKTVVVTHHFPHHLSISPKYAGDRLNPAFGSELPKEMLTKADLWIHGHTHDSVYYAIDFQRRQVKVVANPRGYPQRGVGFENDEFDSSRILEV